MASGDESDAPASKRLKTLEPPPIQSSSSDKGKSKVEISESEGEESEICCGICLSEAGRGSALIQGCIDSCAHFFCFFCIMEWSKVESRCPLCKARFSAIRRPPKPPVFPSERVVHVPRRDQVYDHFGNLTTGPFDPYAEVQCNVCHSSADDSLLLLCDLCDSASHTYCVGLGATVPEGDWFCSDCSLLRTEHAKTDTSDNCDNQHKFATCHPHQISPTGEPVSIFDIVREPETTYVQGLSLVNSDPSSASPQVVTCKRETLSNDVDDELASSRTKLSAKTLWRCRNVNDRIRTLRENWNGLQSGSLYFPSSKNHDSGIAKRKQETGCDKGSDEINKAWKMCDIAKSVVRNHDGSKTLTQTSKLASKKMNTGAEACGGLLNSRSSHRQQLGFNCIGQEVPHRYHPLNKNYHMKNRSQTSGQRQKQENVTLKQSPNVKECFLEKMNTYTEAGGGHSSSLSRHRQHLGNSGSGSHLQYHPLDKNYQMNRSQMSGQQQKQDTITLKVPLNVQECFSTTHLALHSKMTSSKQDRALFQSNACDKSGHMKKKDPCSILPGSNSSMSLAETVSSISHSKEELGLSSSRNKAKHLKDKVGPEKIDESRKAKGEYEAKSEIQSLVKLNLKLLSKDKKLEAEKFKEIARLSTHSILAACGLEQRRPGIPAFPNSICFHVNEASEIRRSTLMPNSCRECFFLFVKDVVNSIMLERKG